MSVINTRSFGRFWPVSWAVNHRFAVPKRYSWLLNPGCPYVPFVNTRIFGPFLPVSWAINHRFGVLERFPLLTIPEVRLRVGHQHSQFLPILDRFMDYYSLFWGPGVVSMLNEPCGAFTCRSSTLAVLASSGPFLGLLTVLGSRSDFYSC